jgi:hypothetical protein
MKRLWNRQVLLLILACCAFAWLLVPPTTDAAQSKAPTVTTNDHHGWALLYDLLGDEKNVSKLLIVKRDRPELKALVKQISDTAAKAHKEFEKFAKRDHTLNLKDTGLPPAELETRKSISKEKAKSLLAEKDKSFEIALLLTQNEALTYGAHLAQTVASFETNPDRNRFLQQLSAELLDLRNKVAAMLRENLK